MKKKKEEFIFVVVACTVNFNQTRFFISNKKQKQQNKIVFTTPAPTTKSKFNYNKI